MFNPDLSKILKNGVNRYSLVRATAKRAREISQEADKKKIIMTEKPVSVALEEILSGKYVIVGSEETETSDSAR